MAVAKVLPKIYFALQLNFAKRVFERFESLNFLGVLNNKRRRKLITLKNFAQRHHNSWHYKGITRVIMPLCKMISGIELMGSWSGVRCSTKKIASRLRLTRPWQAFLISDLNFKKNSVIAEQMTMERNKVIIIVCQRNRVQGPMVIINDILVGPETEKFQGISCWERKTEVIPSLPPSCFLYLFP